MKKAEILQYLSEQDSKLAGQVESALKAKTAIKSQIDESIQQLSGVLAGSLRKRISTIISDLRTFVNLIQNLSENDVSHDKQEIMILLAKRERGIETWTSLIEQLKTQSAFITLFEVLGIEKEEWRRSKTLNNCGYDALRKKISLDPRFGDWNKFLEWMGDPPKPEIDSKILEKTYVEQVDVCSTIDDFYKLFALHGIENEDWRSSSWMAENGFSGLLQAIRHDSRFASWNSFIEWMGPPMHEVKIDKGVLQKSYVKQVASCKMPDDFLNLFKLHKIKGDNWMSADYLQKNGFQGLQIAIRIDQRFGTWKKFIEFMCTVNGSQLNENILKRTYPDQVSACKTSDDFRELFRMHGIKGDTWESASWLQRNGYSALQVAISSDNRFGNWNKFLAFMSITREEPWTVRVRDCKNAEDFNELFNKLNIPIEKRHDRNWLCENDFSGFVNAIYKDDRFATWESFLIFTNLSVSEHEEEFEKIQNLKISEVVSLFGHSDPQKLKFYLQFMHSDLTEEEIDRLIIASFRGMGHGRSVLKEQQYLKFENTLSCVDVHEREYDPERGIVTISGGTSAPYICIGGCWNRCIRVENGSFSIEIPLKPQTNNEIRIMAIDPSMKTRSRCETYEVFHAGKEDDIETLLMLLGQMKGSLYSEIRSNPGRKDFLIHCTEKVLIRKFARSFAEGEAYVKGLVERTESPIIRQILNNVLSRFKKIDKMIFPNVEPGTLMFFQKFCAAEIRRRIKEGESGVVLANDPGLGKTRTILASISDKEAGIFAPNAVVSAWGEEATAMLSHSDLLVMRDIPHAKRKELLRNREQLRYVTNIQFLRNTKDAERFDLLSHDDMIIVHDEAHSRVNEHSEQSKGAKKLKHRFQINVTATPAKNPSTVCRILRTLYPNDVRFESIAAFSKAFPQDNPQSLKTLNLLLAKSVIRFRKSDVLDEVDPSRSLKQQSHRLPKKEFIDSEHLGKFEIGEKQAEALYEMFVDWDKWSRKYKKYIPDDDVAEQDNLRVAGVLTRYHALRQTVNNPSYIGSKEPDMKAWQMERIVKKELREGRKIVIFCAYNAQALKYGELFKKYKPAMYTGLTSNQGDKIGSDGVPLRFKKDEENGSWVFNAKGYPIEDVNGETMSALDYERLTFQNADDRKLIICTYAAGSVGTTFTAGKTLIEDDLPSGCIEDIQAEDRIHRIDPQRLTHPTARYYKLSSRYPKRFLERMKKEWVVRDEDGKKFRQFSSEELARKYASKFEKSKVETAYDAFFAQGTYDEVHGKNLLTQRAMFHLINDGIADESILKEGQIKFRGIENGNE